MVNLKIIIYVFSEIILLINQASCWVSGLLLTHEIVKLSLISLLNDIFFLVYSIQSHILVVLRDRCQDTICRTESCITLNLPSSKSTSTIILYISTDNQSVSISRPKRQVCPIGSICSLWENEITESRWIIILSQISNFKLRVRWICARKYVIITNDSSVEMAHQIMISQFENSFKTLSICPALHTLKQRAAIISCVLNLRLVIISCPT